MKKLIPCEQLRNGNRVWIQGELFTVANIRTMSSLVKPDTKVIRFDGYLDWDSPLYKTSYNGATYGWNVGERCLVDL